MKFLVVAAVAIISASLPAASAHWLDQIGSGISGGPASDLISFKNIYTKEGEKSKGSGLLTLSNASLSYYTCEPGLNSADCEAMIPGKLAYCYHTGNAVPLTLTGYALTDPAALNTDIVVKANVCGCYGVSASLVLWVNQKELAPPCHARVVCSLACPPSIVISPPRTGRCRLLSRTVPSQPTLIIHRYGWPFAHSLLLPLTFAACPSSFAPYPPTP